MAQIPDKSLIEAIQRQTQLVIEGKQKEQAEDGKTFYADSYGPGVIPEEVWQEKKEQSHD